MERKVPALLFVLFSCTFSAWASSSAADTVVFDLSKSVCSGNIAEVPVFVSSADTLNTLDFSLKYDEIQLTYDSTLSDQIYLSTASHYNTGDSTLRSTSFALSQLSNNTPLVSVYFTMLNGKINSSYFNSLKAYVNDVACPVKLIDPIPDGAIIPGGPTTFNPGDSVQLTAAVGTGYSYLWSTSETTQSIYAHATANYAVNIKNTNGCISSFSVDVTVNVTLPVALINFSVQEDNGKVEMKWITASEINNDYFTVDRSKDGILFEAIAKLRGAGNSHALLNYSYEDNDPLYGTSYYRLTQTDYDGLKKQSKIAAVSNTKPKNMIKLFPNPASDIVYLNINWHKMLQEADFELSVVDSKGTEVLPRKAVKMYYGMLYGLDISSLAKGIYIIQLTNVAGTQQEKLIVK